MTPDPSPKRPEPRLSAFFSPITELPPDVPVSVTGELGVQLRRDEADAYRQVLARHRWLRTAVAFLVAMIALEAGSMASPGEAAIAVVGYAAIAHLAWFIVRPGRDTSVALVLNSVAVTLGADVLLGAMLVSTDAASLLRFLIMGGLVSWVAAYFFSWRFAIGVSAGYVAAYILLALTVPGLDHTVTFHAANLALFGVVAGLATWTLARQRRFYAELHVFCRQVARGDIGIRLPLASSESGNAVVRLARDIDSMRKGLAEQIGVDALTGCLNRRALESRLRGEWRLARRRGSLVAVAAVDVDHFKLINDSHGHAAGDEVLQRLALIMKSCARESDAVARLGGDEFVMILPDTDADGARHVAERVRERVAVTVFGTAELPITVTVSMGAVSLPGTDNLAPSDVLDMADRALYQSKQKGRNRVSFGGH
jgi:diguanylate cyclase (GGDEF)-like protein